MITFQKESFAQIMPELPAIFLAHWKEVAMDHAEIPLDPDWEAYCALERAGMLHTLTVRADGILVGYYQAFVKSHMHYKSSLTAWSDLLYLLPEYRKSGKGLASTGFKLVRTAERMLKQLGVQKTYLMTKQYIPLNILVERLNYRMTEIVYTKLL